MKQNLILKRERELHGWSQAKIAELVGTNPPTVSRWERGIAQPSPYFREKLCTLFGKDAAALGILPENEEPLSETAESFPDPPLTPPASSTGPIYDPSIPLPQGESRELIGREQHLQQIKQALFSAKPGMLMVLHGLPGVGKTALAMALAHDPDLQSFFADGILWAGVGMQPDLLGILSRWGHLLHITPPAASGNSETWARALHETIGRRRLLIVLDDVWDVEDIMALKVGGPQCAYLITTRIPRVALDAGADEMLPIPELGEQDSLKLLTHFIPTLVSDNPREAQILVNVVGGLPLALTLLGKYLRVSASQSQSRRLFTMMEQIFDPGYRFHLQAPYSPLDRHPSLSAGTPLSLHSIIEMSDQYIDEQSRQTLRALSVFPAKPNSFSEDAALAVSQVSIAVLDKLYDAGLLESHETRRYMLHQNIADYARIHLQDQHTYAQRMVRYFVHFCQDNSQENHALELESRNILAALEWAQTLQLHQEYVNIVAACAPFFQLRRISTLAITLLERGCQLAEAISDLPRLSILLLHLGQMAREQGNIDQATTYFQRGLTITRQLQDNNHRCLFLMNLAELAELQGNSAQCHLYLQEHLQLQQRIIHRDHFPATSNTRMTTLDKVRIAFSDVQDMIRQGQLTDLHTILQAYPLAQSFSPAILQILSGPDGHLYGIPLDAYNLCLIYNRHLFQQASLDPDAPPTTWEEFHAAAQRLTNPAKGQFGFAETTIHNQGGWHFTNWLYTAGVRVQTQINGTWRTTFNTPSAIAFLEMLQQMRFSDHALPKKALLGSQEIEDMLLHERLAMAVAPPTLLIHFRSSAPSVFEHLGLAPMPQHGGNACLLGGNALVFPLGTPTEIIKLTINDLLVKRFNPKNYEARLQEAAKTGSAIGIPDLPLFTGPIQHQLSALDAHYTNVPLQRYQPYLNNPLTLVPEPPIQAQQFYALIDPVLQTILMDPHAQPTHLLSTVEQTFNDHFLTTSPS